MATKMTIKCSFKNVNLLVFSLLFALIKIEIVYVVLARCTSKTSPKYKSVEIS